MNSFTYKSIDNRTILNEILTGNWLISHSGLLQLEHFFKTIAEYKASDSKENDRSANLLSFYNENHERISPSNVGEIPEGTIAVVNCIGPMMKYGNDWMLGSDEVIWQLDFLNNLQNVKAIILYVDGPGGAVSAISPFIEFAKRKKKPIVALCDASLSLHRWIPDAIADYQMADNNISARFGSVGVVSNWMDFEKYYENLDIIIHEVYPEESKHKNEIPRAIKEDKEKGYKMLRDMYLRPMALAFQEAVKKAHPNLIEEEGVLTGRTFGADEAVRLNMINKVGSLKDAMLVAQALSEAQSVNI